MQSASSVVPAMTRGQAIRCDGLMDASDIADSTLLIPIGVEWSTDGGVTWDTLIGYTWRGGQTDRHTGLPIPPIMVVQMDDGNSSLLVGNRIRVFAELPRVVNLGMDVTVGA